MSTGFLGDYDGSFPWFLHGNLAALFSDQERLLATDKSLGLTLVVSGVGCRGRRL